MKNIYRGKDLAIIIPTKDRPHKIQNLLASLTDQTVHCGRIIIINGGVSLDGIIQGFSEKLPIECHECRPAGQVRQRNMGIGKLDATTKLVACIDDDIVFEEKAIENMINFWNNVEPETAGVGFTLVNESPHQPSLLKSLLGIGGTGPGEILASGYNTSIHGGTKSFRTKWLCGGATVWKQEILQNFTNQAIDTPWAICEDISFSYPIGKKYPLYVCGEARGRHEHNITSVTNRDLYLFRGKTSALWRLHFVRANEDLSLIAFYWMTVTTAVAGGIIALLKLDWNYVKFHLGRLVGAFIGLKAIVTGVDIISLLREPH